MHPSTRLQQLEQTKNIIAPFDHSNIRTNVPRNNKVELARVKGVCGEDIAGDKSAIDRDGGRVNGDRLEVDSDNAGRGMLLRHFEAQGA